MVRVPGVWISRGSEQEHLTAVRSAVLSGPGACGAFLLQENGVPIRPAGFCNVNNLFELNVEQAAAIEVIRGPASALYGGNALHGVINVVAPGGRARPAPARVGVEVGPWKYFRLGADLSAAVGEGAVRAVLSATSSDGWRDDTGHDQQKLSVAWDRAFGSWQASTLLSATNLKQDTGGFVMGFESYKDFGPCATPTRTPKRIGTRGPCACRASCCARLDGQSSRGGDALSAIQRDGVPAALSAGPAAGEERPVERRCDRPLAQSAASSLSWTVGGHLEYADTWLEQFQNGPTIGTPFLVGHEAVRAGTTTTRSTARSRPPSTT
jgi:iron complex outermembrane recepter protein